ncbi:DUF418 domain-containing protein [Texcoconibacillus texcoconensis]|uniref:DUF418 domain-containing protein n=1 Tax=Texcoconibacillus texcoconensis TaxID=1095777 RepID=A0A840QSJ4_9BACI|nr:DUF418 domain-containing protein [Texcoconibacillus texcoconensis]MBB5174482.1 uncharacterized protein [Texcoconibacillus texcoconensis]
MKQQVQPTEQQGRIEILDVLRGFALFGILLVNMQFFNTPKILLVAAEMSVWESTADKIVIWLIDMFASGSFFTIFSFLFGIGFYIFMERIEQKGLEVVPYYRRRLIILGGMGFIHLVFLWSSDILFTYAIAGFLLLLFRDKTAQSLRKWAILLFLFVHGVLATLLLFTTLFGFVSELEEEQSQLTTVIEQAFMIYPEGSFMDILLFRLQYELPLLVWDLFVVVPIVLAVFLLGLYVAKSGILYNLSSYTGWIHRVWKWTLFVGVTFTTVWFVLKQGWLLNDSVVQPALVELIASINGLVICLFYITSFVKLSRIQRMQKLLSPLSYVGRMALTNYLMQTAICIMIFNGFGFGLYGSVGPALGIVFTVMIYLFQVIFSYFWLRFFRYGPLEWIWRMLTYQKKQPIRL